MRRWRQKETNPNPSPKAHRLLGRPRQATDDINDSLWRENAVVLNEKAAEIQARIGTIRVQAVKSLSLWLNSNTSIRLRNFLRNVQTNMKHSMMDDLAVRKCRRVMQSLLNNAASLAVQRWMQNFKDHRAGEFKMKRVMAYLFAGSVRSMVQLACRT